MKSTTTLIILGVLIALLPFSGLPGSWRNILCVVFGLSIASIVFYHVRTSHRKHQDTEEKKKNNNEPSEL